MSDKNREKKYTWKNIVEKIVIPPEYLNNEEYKDEYQYAIEYHCNLYYGDNAGTLFTEKEVIDIITEIKEEAEHKIQLIKNMQFHEDNPNISAYIQNLLNRGPYPS